MVNKIQVQKRLHKGWIEWQEMKKKHPDIARKMSHPNGFFGKYQYIFTSNRGEISMIELPNYWKKGENLWEIYELSANKLFEDTQRFSSKKKAEKVVKHLLSC
jgi:hypothetical protein